MRLNDSPAIIVGVRDAGDTIIFTVRIEGNLEEHPIKKG